MGLGFDRVFSNLPPCRLPGHPRSIGSTLRFEAVLKSVVARIPIVGLPPIGSSFEPWPEAKQPFEHNGSEGLLSPDTPQ